MYKVLKAVLAACVVMTVANAAGGGGAYQTPKDVDVKNGKKIYEEKCVACHGPKGMAPQDSVSPPLNGQYARYMVTQLEAFVDTRPKYQRNSLNSAQMIPFAQMLSKKEMWDVSVYLERVRERRTFPKEWWDKNKKDIEWANKRRKASCTACHGKDRAGRYQSGPKLAGLSAKYLEEQTKAYSNGTRKGAQSMQMKLIADFFSEEDLRKIYLAIEAAEAKK